MGLSVTRWPDSNLIKLKLFKTRLFRRDASFPFQLFVSLDLLFLSLSSISSLIHHPSFYSPSSSFHDLERRPEKKELSKIEKECSLVGQKEARNYKFLPPFPLDRKEGRWKKVRREILLLGGWRKNGGHPEDRSSLPFSLLYVSNLPFPSLYVSNLLFSSWWYTCNIQVVSSRRALLSNWQLTPTPSFSYNLIFLLLHFPTSWFCTLSSWDHNQDEEKWPPDEFCFDEP